MIGSKRAGLAIVLGAAVATAACKKSDDAAVDTGAGAAAVDTGMAVAPAPPSALTDANIVYILDNANMLDSAAGAVASTRGQLRSREFGKGYARPHRCANREGPCEEVRTAEAPPNDDSKASYARVKC